MDKKKLANLQLKEFKQDTVILIDSREKKIDHILLFLEMHNISYEILKLDTGDYSFIYKNIDYRNLFSIDRKHNIDELISNFSEKRFMKELARSLSLKYFSLAVEFGKLGDIYLGKYLSLMKIKSSIALIEAWKNRGINFEFIEGIGFGKFISTKIYYFIRQELLNDSLEISQRFIAKTNLANKNKPSKQEISSKQSKGF